MQGPEQPQVVREEEATGWRGALARMESFGWPRVLAFLSWVLLVVSTYASLDPVIGDGTLSLLGLVTLKTVPLLLAVLVALPNVTLFIIARMILFRFARRSFSLQFASEPEARAVPAAALRQAEWLWSYEKSRAQTRYEAGLLPQVAVFGLLSSATLSFCVLGIHLPPEQLFPNMGVVPTWHIWVAWTVLGTATTSFLLTIGRILVRIAGDDATTRTFANAARSYGLCVVSGGLLACLTVSTTEAAETAQMSIAMGIAVGLLGDRAFLAVSNRAAALLGAEPEVVDPGNELRSIEGLGAEDQQRLQEESIGSVHALAFVPVPRLFFNSSLNLQRICDWQDQALLQVYIGATRARALREFFQIRGAIDAQRLADSHEDLPPEVWQQLVACMSFPSEAHLRQLFKRLTSDGRIDELRAYRGATLRIDMLLPGARRV